MFKMDVTVVTLSEKSRISYHRQRLVGLDYGLEKIQKILTFLDWIWIANPFCRIVGFPPLDWIDQSNPSNFPINQTSVSSYTKIGSYFHFNYPGNSNNI